MTSTSDANRYYFELEDFAVSGTSIHLLRNRFNFKTIDYNEIEAASVERGPEFRNGPIIMLLGIALVCFAFYQSMWIVDLFNDHELYTIHINSILLPVIPGFLGIYCLYTALRRGPLLVLQKGNRIYRLRLRSAVRDNSIGELGAFLSEKLGTPLPMDAALLK